MPNLTEGLKLTEAGRQELALALIFLKDFKSQGLFDVQVTGQIIIMARILGVERQFGELLSKIPPMIIEPRYKEGHNG